MSPEITDLSSVDAYFAAFPPETRQKMEQIRAVIRALVPEAEECISYAIPAFRLRGRGLVYFSAWKKHIGLYPVPAGDEAFQAEIQPYRVSKGSLHFSLFQPLPLELIEKVVRLRRQEVEAGRSGV